MKSKNSRQWKWSAKGIWYNPKLFIFNFLQSNVICSYFTFRNCRVKEWNRIYDCGWIYCTNEITKFMADMIVFWREYNPDSVVMALFYIYHPQYKFKGLFWSVDKVK